MAGSEEAVVLRVVADYRAGNVHYAAGTLLHLDRSEAERLRRDSPGCFEVEGAEPRRPRATKGPARVGEIREPIPGARDRLARGGAERAARREAELEAEG